MTDETFPHAPGPDAPAIPGDTAPQPDPELENPAGGDGIDPDGADQADDDFEEIDWSGKKFRAPKGLRDSLLMHADYTRKTQEVAAHRKALEDRARQIDQQATASEEDIADRAKLHHIKAELARFEKFGWAEYQQLRQTDPLGADEAWQYVQHLKAEKQAAEGQISARQTQRAREAQQEIAKRIEETNAYARTIPGMTAEIHGEVLKLAMDKGVDPEALASVMNPTVYDILYHARLGYQVAQAKKTPPKPGTTQAKPLETVGGKASPSPRKTLASMDMDEYVAARSAGRKG